MVLGRIECLSFCGIIFHNDYKVYVVRDMLSNYV